MNPGTGQPNDPEAPLRAAHRRDVVCFANDWDAPPTGKHHLMRLVARRRPVLWVESAGMRTPRLGSASDLRRGFGKLRNFLRPARDVEAGLRVLTPPTLPAPTSTLARGVNAILWRGAIARERRRHEGTGNRPDVWAFAPHIAPLTRWMEPHLMIYYCVDRWSAFSEYDEGLMERWGAEMCRRADVVLASATELVELCRPHSRSVFYVPHGVEHDHFARALESGPVPDDLVGIPEPRIGFFGLIHEWMDLELVRRLALETPYSYVFIGDVAADISRVRELENVHFLGRRPYQSLPDYCRGFRAAIVPFVDSDLTRSVNPVKLREYAAAGLPVVATDLPEVRRCSDIASCASSAVEWLMSLKREVWRGGQASERRRQSARAASRSWSAVLHEIDEILDDVRSEGETVSGGTPG